MTHLQRLFRPLRNALQVFFAHDVALRRGEAGVEIVLAERPAPGQARKPSRHDATQEKERAELALMHQQLAALLDDQPETRGALRHLAFVEQSLARKGWRALHKLPLDVLQRALEQLEGLVVNWSPVGLANLRSKMAVAIIDREHMDPQAEVDAYRTAMPMETAPGVADLDEMAGVPDGVDAAHGSDTGAEAAALAAAYAAAFGAVAPSPAALAADTLAQAQAGAQAALARISTVPGDPLEFHNELGSQAARTARAQTRANPTEPAKLPAIQLRELQG